MGARKTRTRAKTERKRPDGEHAPPPAEPDDRSGPRFDRLDEVEERDREREGASRARREVRTAEEDERLREAGNAAPAPDAAAAAPAPAEGEAAPDAEDGPFLLVGIGGSAGSLEPLQDFLAHMPADCGMAFIVMSHGDPDQPSLLPELLGKRTRMPVRAAEDGARAEPGCVYVARSGHHLEIKDRHLRLQEKVARGHPPLPIDVFLRSLAEDMGHRAVGIVLSGTGTDGTLGLGAIRQHAGLTLAQDPDTADFPGMPGNAIGHGVVDFALAPGEIPERLLRYARSLNNTRAPEPPDDGELERIVRRVAKQAGHDFSGYKRGMLLRRIERRMSLHQLPRLRDYARLLERDRDEVEALWRDWLIGVTAFFRDREAFRGLEEQLDLLLEQKEERDELRIWVPGCARGEEAYSLAILALEAIERSRKKIEVTIFATDLDGEAIETARIGRYPEGIAADVGEERLRRFFVEDNAYYRVKRDVRDRVVFAPHDLLSDPPFTRIDVLSCRNVLIYFTTETQRRVLSVLHYALRPGGLLFLSPSESPTGFAEQFEPLDRRWKLYRRRQGPAHPETLPRRGRFGRGERREPQAERERTAPPGRRGGPPDLADVLRKQLADQYGPPSVVVNEEGRVEQIHGRTGEYLEPAPGQASLQLTEMAREGLRGAVLAALREAREGGEGAERRARLRTNGETQPVRVRARRLADPRLDRALFLVTFERLPKEEARPRRGRRRRGQDDEAEARVAELEAELRAVREDHQATIEERQASNEELASSNEEVQSINEELQSTNEELQTSKEEAQSLNEELQTVNAELNAKVDSLERASDDLANLMNHAELAFVFLDEELRVQRFTSAAQDLFRLIDSDVGRPLADLATSLDYPDLIEDAREVLRTLVPRQTTVRSSDGRWFSASIRVYRTTRNAIEGLVLVFTDVTRTLEAVAEARVLGEIVDTVREPLVVLDRELRVVRANASFYRTFRVEPRETEGELLYRLGNAQWDIPELRRLLEEILPERSQFTDYRVEHEFPDLGRRTMLLNARRVAHEGGNTQILLAIEDVTGEPREREEPA